MVENAIMEEDESKENSSELDDKSHLLSKDLYTPSGTIQDSDVRSSEGEGSEGEESEGEGEDSEYPESEESEDEGTQSFADSQKSEESKSIEGSQSIQHEGGEGESPPVAQSNQMYRKEEAQPVEMGIMPDQYDNFNMNREGKYICLFK